MSTQPNDSEVLDFDALYLKALKGVERLEGKPYYEPEADSIFHFFKEGASNALRINGFLTIYRSIETGEVVGIQLKRVKKLTQELLSKRGKGSKGPTVKVLLKLVIGSRGKSEGPLKELLDMPQTEQQLPSEALV